MSGKLLAFDDLGVGMWIVKKEIWVSGTHKGLLYNCPNQIVLVPRA